MTSLAAIGACFGRVASATCTMGAATGCASEATIGLFGSLLVESGAATALALKASGRAIAATAERTVVRSMRGPPVGWTVRACALRRFHRAPIDYEPATIPVRLVLAGLSLGGYPGSQPDIADNARDADSRVNTFDHNP